MQQSPLSLAALGTLEDPYSLVAELRENSRVAQAAEGFAVLRYADVWQLSRDRRISHEFPRWMLEYAYGDGPTTEFQTNSLLNREGEDHHRLRRLMNKAFHAGTVRLLRAHIEELVDEMLEPLLDGETRDLVDELAFPLPSAVICELLGIPTADRALVRSTVASVSPHDMIATDAAIAWLRDYMSEVLAERAADDAGDLFSRMLAAEDADDRLSHQEIVDNALLLFIAGFETTKNVITSGVVALDAFPDQRRLLWSDPTVTPTAIEEILRYDAPVHYSPRVALADIDLGGDVIPSGSFVQLWLSSANHDPRAFEQPTQLDVTRSPNHHVSFGGGAHYCLGAMLARVEADVVFRRLAGSATYLEVAAPPVRSAGGTIGTYAAVPIRATLAS